MGKEKLQYNDSCESHFREVVCCQIYSQPLQKAFTLETLKKYPCRPARAESKSEEKVPKTGLDPNGIRDMLMSKGFVSAPINAMHSREDNLAKR